MDKLRKLIEPQVYGSYDLYQKRWKPENIQLYCDHRRKLWEKGVVIFKELFSHMGILYINKEYNQDTDIMEVTVKQLAYCYTKTLAQHYHKDPLFALAECAKTLNNEDEFLAKLLAEIQV